MFDIDETYRWLEFLVNSKQSGKFTPDSFNLGCKVVNLEYFNQESGLEEEYQVGNPHARIEWQQTAKITDNNRNFLVEKDISKVGLYFPLPSDYGAFSSYEFGYIFNPPGCANATRENTVMEIVTDGELRTRLNNPIKKPTLKRSIGAYYQQGIRPWPEEITLLHITYLRLPVPPFRNYTLVNDQDIYNPTGSRGWEWPETVIPTLIYRLGLYCGINIREENFYQMMAARIAKGK